MALIHQNPGCNAYGLLMSDAVRMFVSKDSTSDGSSQLKVIISNERDQSVLQYTSSVVISLSL